MLPFDSEKLFFKNGHELSTITFDKLGEAIAWNLIFRFQHSRLVIRRIDGSVVSEQQVPYGDFGFISLNERLGEIVFERKRQSNRIFT